MVCVSFYVICIVERLVSSVICRFQGLSYSHVPECIEFSFILFIHHNIHFYFELCTYCNILDIYLSWNMNSVKYLFIWNYLFCDMFGGILECYELTHCPASRTTLVATRFRVAVICPIIQVPHCIRVFFYFVWFVFINHIFQFYYELCTYCNILDIYLS